MENNRKVKTYADAYEVGYEEGYKQGFIDATTDTDGSLMLIKQEHEGYTLYKPRFSLDMTNESFVELFREFCEVNHLKIHPINRSDKGQNWKDTYILNVFSKDLRRTHLLERMRLTIKERQRVLLLEALSILPGRQGVRISKAGKERLDEIWLEMRELNRRGKASNNGSQLLTGEQINWEVVNNG